MDLPDDFWPQMKRMVEEASKYRQDEKVMLVNRVMHDKLHAYFGQMAHVETPASTAYGLPSQLAINFMSGAIEVQVIGPMQYGLYGDKNPDETALLVTRDVWRFMCGDGPLWEQALAAFGGGMALKDAGGENG